jgi:hypothetical protein
MKQRDHIPITGMYTLGPQLFVQPDWKKNSRGPSQSTHKKWLINICNTIIHKGLEGTKQQYYLRDTKKHSE